MPIGYDRREVTQDPNANAKPVQPGAEGIPNSPVQAPQPSSFSRVGESERALAEVFGNAAPLFDKYMQKKAEEWKLEGQMMYAEGATEAEIAASGNRYTMAGFMTMKARTAANEWQQNALNEIETSDHQMTSPEYQAKLKGQYKDLVDSTAGTDPFTRHLMGTIAENTFPQLVSTQIKANNSWREKETYDSYSGLLVSETLRPDYNPEHMKELLGPVSGLSPERQRAAIVDAIQGAWKAGNNKIADVLGMDEEAKVIAESQSKGLPAWLHAGVRWQESHNKMNAVGPNVPGQGSAKSDMQVMDATNLNPGYGVTPARDNSLAERSRVGSDYLAAMWNKFNQNPILALAGYNYGPAATDAAIEKAGNPADGPSFYAKFMQMIPKQTQDYIKSIMGNKEAPLAQQVTKKVGFVQSLVNAGFSAAELSTLQTGYTAFTAQKANEFSKQRVLDEQQIIKAAEGDGNLAAGLDKVIALGDANNYGDAWKNEMSNHLVSAVNTYQKENAKLVTIQNMVSTNTLAQGTADQQQKGIDIYKAQITGEAQAHNELSQEQKGEYIRKGTMKFLADNNIVDQKWKASMEATLSGNIMDSKGKVKPEAIAAYQDYLDLSKAMNPGYAAKYLGEAAPLVAMAESYDGGSSMASGDALQIASEILTRKRTDANYTPPSVDPVSIQTGVDKLVSTFDSWWPMGTSNYKTRSWQVLDSEIHNAKSDPRLGAWLHDKIVQNMMVNPNITQQAAEVMARNEATSKVDYTMGNILFGGKQSTIRQDMGLNVTDPTALDVVMQSFLHTHGKKMFGPAFDDFQILGSGDPNKTFFENPLTRLNPMNSTIGQSIKDVVRGTPQAMISYDPDRKAFRIDLYKNKERTAILNAPQYVTAKELGAYGNALFAPKNDLTSVLLRQAETAAQETVKTMYNSSPIGMMENGVQKTVDTILK